MSHSTVIKNAQHPVNNSKSKQLYSFPKAQRFRYKEQPYCSTSFYETRDTFGAKHTGVSFGSGTKVDFSKLGTRTPGPNNYNPHKLPKQDFSRTICTMGTGRIVPKQRDIIPAPGAYTIQPHGSSISYTIRPKLEPKINTITPGPGRYKLDLKPSSKSIFLDTRTQRTCHTPEITPGPQHYKPNTSLSPNGRYSVHESISAGVFSKQDRFVQPKLIVPGPGHYTLPSEFAIY